MASSSSRAAASKKIIRPWLAEPGGARDHDKEVYLADPWLQDPVHTRKMFTLAGFVATARVSAEEMRRQKEEIMANIRWVEILLNTTRERHVIFQEAGWRDYRDRRVGRARDTRGCSRGRQEGEHE